MSDRQKIKILHTMTWLAPGGGVDKNVFYTLSGLKNDYDFHLVSGSEIHHNPFESIKEIRFVICKNLIRKISPVNDLMALLFLRKLIKNEKYDIVHTHETKASLLTRIAAYLAGCRVIIYGLHGVTFNDPHSSLKRYFYILLEKATAWMSDFIVSVSQDCIDRYHEASIARNIPYKVIYSGIDIRLFAEKKISGRRRTDLRHSLGIKDDDLLLINVGRFSLAKGQRFTIEAFARLKKEYENLKLLLVGEGERQRECMRQAEELGVQNEVIFYGFSDAVQELLWISDIFVLTSLREGLPRVVVEASLCRIPTVGFDVEGMREIVNDGESGFIVPQYEVRSLADKIKILLNDPEMRSEFAEKAYRRAASRWDKDIMVDQLKKLYCELIEDREYDQSEQEGGRFF